MKKILFIALLACASVADAQVKKVSLQASGLTCSMCSNAINKALKAIDFVDKVAANIKTSTFVISFKDGMTVDFDRLKKAVENAGFFVANFTAVVHFDNATAENDHHLSAENRVYHFIGIKDQGLNGDVAIRFLDKGFVSSKEFRKNNALTKMACYKTGTASPCCEKDGLKAGTRIYHVTI